MWPLFPVVCVTACLVFRSLADWAALRNGSKDLVALCIYKNDSKGRKIKLLLLYYDFKLLSTYWWTVCWKQKNPKSRHSLVIGSLRYVWLQLNSFLSDFNRSLTNSIKFHWLQQVCRTGWTWGHTFYLRSHILSAWFSCVDQEEEDGWSVWRCGYHDAAQNNQTAPKLFYTDNRTCPVVPPSTLTPRPHLQAPALPPFWEGTTAHFKAPTRL